MSGVSDFGRDHGLMHEVVVTGRKAGWGQAEWASLAEDVDLMRRVRSVLVEEPSSLLARRNVINLDLFPKIPRNFGTGQRVRIEEHLLGGLIEWPDEFLSRPRVELLDWSGVKLKKSKRAELALYRPLNANFLNYIFRNNMPDWSRYFVLFPGSLYSEAGAFFIEGVSFKSQRWATKDSRGISTCSGVGDYFIHRHWLSRPLPSNSRLAVLNKMPQSIA